ncbi:NAD(P)/FAD-dependent oxidoreductase [Nocardia sp. NPDC050710]|uniref:flavin-containing monooxygenase n=1 Tax=Nocardia sp. NPDC050710 TaxID=3157220 RepID=UPI0033BFF28E
MDTDLKVAIIGAGFGGLGMGVALAKQGIDEFVIFDEADELGGVWRDNTYPGCRCDVPSHWYSFSFAPYRDPVVRYPDQSAILAYLQQVVDTFELRPHLRLSTTIVEASYLDSSGTWRLSTAAGEQITAETVVFAVGMLHRPQIPAITGLDSFRGRAFHSARWDHSAELTGRDVAVIGTGASAAQIVPQIAATARRVMVYQRTPTWVLPKPRTDFGPVTRWALTHIPGMHALYRWGLYRGADAVLAPVMVRGWSARPAEWIARAHLYRHIRDQALRAVLTPAHRIGAKRILLSNDYYPALSRDNVELITAPIHAVTEHGIRTGDGIHRRADVLVWATGFRASEYLVPIRVRGRGGRMLHREWAAGAEAFLGTAVRGFPNMFIIAGPSTFNSGGSNIAIKEAQIRYVVAAMRWRERSGAAAIEVSAQAMDAYRRWLNQALARTVWPAGGPSWYKNGAGRLISPWPSTTAAFDRAARRDPSLAFVPVAAADPPRRKAVALPAARETPDSDPVRCQRAAS